MFTVSPGPPMFTVVCPVPIVPMLTVCTELLVAILTVDTLESAVAILSAPVSDSILLVLIKFAEIVPPVIESLNIIDPVTLNT